MQAQILPRDQGTTPKAICLPWRIREYAPWDPQTDGTRWEKIATVDNPSGIFNSGQNYQVDATVNGKPFIFVVNLDAPSRAKPRRIRMANWEGKKGRNLPKREWAQFQIAWKFIDGSYVSWWLNSNDTCEQSGEFTDTTVPFTASDVKEVVIYQRFPDNK